MTETIDVLIEAATKRLLDVLARMHDTVIKLELRLAEVEAERDGLRERCEKAEASHTADLKDLQSCVDNIDCDCDPHGGDDYNNHDQCCRWYLYGYIGKLISLAARREKGASE